MSRNLSKSKLLAYRQCPKRLWLEVHRPELRQDSEATQARFKIGYGVGDVAQQVFDPKGKGTLINAQEEGYASALSRSLSLLSSSNPIFEAGFSAEGAIAFADIMLPVKHKGKQAWRMIEVKSATSVKDYHRDDAAIQAWIARKAGVPLSAISVAHIDSDWIYPGNEDYIGLFNEADLTDETLARENEVSEWVAEAHAIVERKKCPSQTTGAHCTDPFECGFFGHCSADDPTTKFPVAWLPGRKKDALQALINLRKVIDMKQAPDELLNEKQLRVKTHTLANTVYFDLKGAQAKLAPYGLPAYFLDFESIQFAVPMWKGTRPYQHIAFQFSLHRLSRSEAIDHVEFINLSGKDPSSAIAKALVDNCGKQGPIYAYSASFEKLRIEELANRFPRHRTELMAIHDRVVDLLPVAQSHYYHPTQEGSWSIKRVLPALTGKNYDDLDGVKNGGMAMDAYLEAIDPETLPERKQTIERELLAYCQLDTEALIDVWNIFTGRQKPAR